MNKRPIAVLLIEDNPGDARLIQERLADAEGSGFTLTRAERLATGVEHLARGPVDVVLLDLSLPDAQGLEGLRTTIRRFPAVPVVILTGREDEALALTAVQEGAQDYLHKGAVQADGVLLARALRHAIERKRAEQELLRLASFPEQSPQPIVEMDLAGTLTYLNPAARAQFEQDPGRQEALKAALQAAIPRLRSAEREALRSEIILGQKIFEQHTSYVPASGVIRSYMVDITERKQVDQFKDDFLSIVSHELRTPLTTIKEFTGMIADEIPGPLTADQREYLGIIKDNIDRLARIINDLLDMSKIESGHILLNRELAEVEPLIGRILQSMRPLAAHKQLTLGAKVPVRLPSLFIDVDKITQVLFNLVSNAIKFTEPNGRIALEVAAEPSSVTFSVQDTGIGIAAEELPRLFQKFHQIRVTYGGSGSKGTGLGLAISKRLIELHGGRIWVTSTPGTGSTFSFALPMYHPEELVHEYFKTGIEQAKSRQSRFTIIAFAIQDFRKLKQLHGPEETNRLLTELEQVLKGAVRRKAGDIVLTWRRNEMVIILSEIDQTGARGMAERLKRIAEERAFHLGNQGLALGVVTAMATYPDEGTTEEDLLRVTEGRLQQADQARARILVVDDELKIRRCFKEALELRAFDVLTAASGPEALELLKTHRIDLILLDLIMPVMGGYEVYHLLKENPETRDIPVLIVTAQGERKDRELGLGGAAYNYLCKPVEVKTLVAKIQEVLVQRMVKSP